MPSIRTDSRGATVAGLALLALLTSSCAGTVPAGEAPTPTAAGSTDLAALPAAPTIAASEYAARRGALAASMEDGVLVVFGAAEPEQDYLPYAQNANFRYLTGVTEAGASLIVVKRGGSVEEMLFVQPRDPSREIWEGVRLGADGAQALTGIPTRNADQFLPTLGTLLETNRALHTLIAPPPAGPDAHRSREQQILARLLENFPETRIVPLTDAVQRLRATKSPAELDLIRRATLISALAHREAMRSAAPGMNEFEIHGLVEYFFRRNGAERPAYSSIVGSGPNATTLHYRSADRFMRDGELLLLDVGAAYRGYAADITRTFPVSGRFSPDQAAIYSIVLDALGTAERQLRVGAAWADLNAPANRVIAEGLTRLGLIDAPDATYDCVSPQAGNRCPQLRLYYMHSLGHGVGLQVHDPDISYFTSFQPGSAFTLEPGIYVRADVLDFLPDTPENRAMAARLRPAIQRYQNIGVRIEDVYLVTASGVERASRDVPREIAEIERLMAETGLGASGRRPEVVEWYPGGRP